MEFITAIKKVFLVLTVSILTLEANPVLARQYGMDCSACHSQAPALNDMGLSFIRNGLRTSTYDTTALSGFLEENSSKRHYPVGAMIGLSDNSYSDDVNRLVKLYLSGTLTDSLSLMALSKETFNSNKSDEALFASDNSQLYLQYNFEEAKHAFRVGLLSPWTQLGNIKRSVAHSGLHGGVGHGNNYLSPLERTNVKKIKGAEYSYLYDYNILLLVSYGERVHGSSSGHHHSYEHANSTNNQTTHSHGDSDRSSNNQNRLSDHQRLLLYGESTEYGSDAFLTAIKYTTLSNYKIGLVYNYVEMDQGDYYSLVLPVEKEFAYFIWNSSLVYADYLNEDYIGLENAFTVPLREMEHLKLIINVDRDESDNNNYAYSLGYTKIYKMFFFEAVAAHIDTETFNSSRLKGSINLIF